MIEIAVIGFASGAIVGAASYYMYTKFRKRNIQEMLDVLNIAKYNVRLHNYIRKHEVVQEELGEDLCGALLMSDVDDEENGDVTELADEQEKELEIEADKAKAKKAKKAKAKKKAKKQKEEELAKEELTKPLEEKEEPKIEEPKKEEEEPKKAVPVEEKPKDEIEAMMDEINGKLKK